MGNMITIINQRTYGVYAGGNVTAEKVTNNINSSSSAKSEVPKPFWFVQCPTRRFSGREQIIKNIRDYFANLPTQEENCWSRIVVISGPAGMGKTQLAYQFASEYSKDYPNANVARISAETEESTLESFKDIAEHLEIVASDYEGMNAQFVKKIYRGFGRKDYRNILLIFDDAPGLHLVKDYLPTEKDSCPYIIITTQTQEWDSKLKTFHVDALREEESLEFFSKCFKNELRLHLLTKLHELLQGYPLAMTVTASAIDYNCIGTSSIVHMQQQIDRYVQNLEKEDEKILTEEIKKHWLDYYKKTVSTAWESTLRRLEQDTDGTKALELLQILSFLKLPRTYCAHSVLVLGTQHSYLANPELRWQLQEWIRVLQKFNIILKSSTTGDIFEVGLHRIFQLVVRQKTDCRKALESCLCYFARERALNIYYIWNKSALDYVLRRIQPSLWESPYVGILGFGAKPLFRRILKHIEPQEKTVVSIRRCKFGEIWLEG